MDEKQIIRRKVRGRIHRSFFLYFLYCLLFTIIYSGLISLVSFFHFQLGHGLNTIDDWIYNHTWEIVFLGKALSFYIFFRFINTQVDTTFSFKNFLMKGVKEVQQYIFVVIFVLITCFAIWGQANMGTFSLLNVYKSAWSLLGVVSLYLSDFILLAFINYLKPVTYKKRNFGWYILMAMTFYVTVKTTLPNAVHFNLMHVIFFGATLFLYELMRDLWFSGTAFILCFIAPVCTFMGLDPVWGKQYSVTILQSEISAISILIILAVSFTYLTRKVSSKYSVKLDKKV